MALTISTQPPSNIVTNQHNVYAVSSSFNTEFNYETHYLVRDGNNDILFEGVVKPNLSGYSVWDIRDVTRTIIPLDLNITTNSSFDIDIPTISTRIQERYLESVSASTYTESGFTNIPHNLFIGKTDGAINQSPQFGIHSPFQFTQTIELHKMDYYTIDAYLENGTNVRVELVESGNTTELFNQPIVGNQHRKFGIGFRNLESQFADFNSVTEYEIIYSIDGGVRNRIRFREVEDTQQFVWNHNGALTYYNFPNHSSTNPTYNTSTYTLNNVGYDTTDGIVTYDALNSGRRVINKQKTDTYSYSTDILTINDETDAIQTIYDSKDVFMIQNGVLVPIYITNTAPALVNSRAQSGFRFTIEFELANPLLDA